MSVGSSKKPFLDSLYEADSLSIGINPEDSFWNSVSLRLGAEAMSRAIHEVDAKTGDTPMHVCADRSLLVIAQRLYPSESSGCDESFNKKVLYYILFIPLPIYTWCISFFSSHVIYFRIDIERSYPSFSLFFFFSSVFLIDLRPQGYTPFHVAVSKGNLEFAKWLLKRGADKMKLTRDFPNRPPIHLACENGHLSTALWLVSDCKADANVKDKVCSRFLTSVSIAVCYSRVILCYDV